MYPLIKFLSLWIYPLGFSIAVASAALIFFLQSWRKTGLWLLAFAIGNLWVFSTPVVAEKLILSLEREWSDQPVESLPMADAVVVLGGAFSSGNGRWVYPNAGGAVDRYWHAARIYHVGKVPIVILSGGRAPHLEAGPTEARMGAMFLQDMGVPSEAIILDEESLTTRDHAIYLAEIVKERRFASLIVVTSASHMRRSMETFGGVAPRLIPAATDFSVSDNPAFTIRRYLPSASALSASTGVIHETVGGWFYGIAGWKSEEQ